MRLDDALRELEGLCAARNWDAVVQFRDRCRAAHERGHQLWPAAVHAEYRLALEAPGEWAGAVVVEEAGRFALGPLAEVAASSHTWAELAPHVPAGPLRSVCAHERVVRGEDLRGAAGVDPETLPSSLICEDWEPLYPVATYRPHEAEFPAPEGVEVAPVSRNGKAPIPSDAGDEVAGLRELAAAWTTGSNGRAEAAAVEGQAVDAIAALGVPAPRMGGVEPAAALAWMAWTAASGGAHGRRRGMAWGRAAAWDCAAMLAGVDIEADGPDALGEGITELRWFLWDDGAPPTGWSLRLAVEDPAHGLAWALAAADSAFSRS